MHNRELMWAVSIEFWKSGAVVTDFLQQALNDLVDADGHPLPDLLQAVLADLVWQRLTLHNASASEVLQRTFADLRDAGGRPLTGQARAFLIDLSAGKIKPRKGRALSKTAIRMSYDSALVLEKHNEAAERNSTPSERAIRSIAAALNVSEDTISGIVHPRKGKISP